MKRINYFFFMLMVSMCVSCYEDKGNYDYIDIENIEIEKFESVYKTLGDTVKIEPKFNVDLPEDVSYLSYEWSIDGKKRPDDPDWNSKNFFWIADEIVSTFNLILKVTDERYGISYMQQGYISISGEFDASYSWMILSEQDGKAMLSFFKTLDTEWSADWSSMTITEWKEYKDLYPSRNGGTELGQGPISMREHYCADYNVDAGNIWIFSESGAVDLEGVGLTKDIDLDQTFMGGVPTGVTIQGGVFMIQADVLYDQYGRLYSRVKSDNQLFNSDYFLPEPMKYDGEVLEQCEPVLGRYLMYTALYTPIIDRKNSRLLAIIDGAINWNDDPLKGAANIIEVPGEAVLGAGEVLPANYIPLNDFRGYGIISMQYRKLTPANSTTVYPAFNILFKDENGNLYLEEFALERKSGANGYYMEVSNVKVFELNGLGGIPSSMVIPPYTTSNYAFFAVDNVLYMLDKDTQILSKYLEFNAPITAMDAENMLQNQYVAVGLENGEFHVVNIVNAKNRPEADRIMCSSKERFGKIIQINWKIGNGRSSWT